MAARSKANRKFQALLKERAALLRSRSTMSEARLWAELSARNLGVAFRRQVPVGTRYIADFLAPSLKLIVEVDGLYHARRVAADARRDRNLSRLGYRVLHLEAELVLHHLPRAVALVRCAIASASVGR